jgi:uncharacterized iron-regulated membrane protein
VVGETPPSQRGPIQPAANANQRSGGAARPVDGPSAASAFKGLDALWARAEQQQAGWRSISLRLPISNDAPVIFTIDQGDGGQPHKRAQLTLNRQTGEVVRWEPFSSYTTGRQLRSILRFAHTGEVAGLIGQTIAGLASAGGAVLVWTGLALALRRFRIWLAKRWGNLITSEVGAEATGAVTVASKD